MSAELRAAEDMPPWSPWDYLRRNYPEHQVIRTYELPGTFWGLQQGRRIWLCSKLNVAQQRSTLAHEIIHLERGIPPVDEFLRKKEEQICDWFASRRLIRAHEFARVAASHPHATSAKWFAHRLWVDRAMMVARLRYLTNLEMDEFEALGVPRRRLERLREAWGADDDSRPELCASAAIVAATEIPEPAPSVHSTAAREKVQS